MQTTQTEFQRQLRSLFAVLRTLVRQTVDGRDSIEDYAAHLEGRIGALARVHEMVMRAPDEGVDLQEIVCGEILVHAIADERFRLDGPDIRLARESAAAIALTFHELIVNALTHGSFSNAKGSAELTWETRHDEGEWLDIHWSEHGTPASEASLAKKGFGTELLERMLPYELSARTSTTFSSDGVRVEISIPARAGTTIWQAGNDKADAE